MKNAKILGQYLTREDQKKIKGGDDPPPDEGGGNCPGTGPWHAWANCNDGSVKCCYGVNGSSSNYSGAFCYQADGSLIAQYCPGN